MCLHRASQDGVLVFWGVEFAELWFPVGSQLTLCLGSPGILLLPLGVFPRTILYIPDAIFAEITGSSQFPRFGDDPNFSLTLSIGTPDSNELWKYFSLPVLGDYPGCFKFLNA